MSERPAGAVEEHIVPWRCGCCGAPQPGLAGDLPPLFAHTCTECGYLVCPSCARAHRRGRCDACLHAVLPER